MSHDALQTELDRLIEAVDKAESEWIHRKSNQTGFEYDIAKGELAAFVQAHREQVVIVVKDEGGLEWKTYMLGTDTEALSVTISAIENSGKLQWHSHCYERVPSVGLQKVYSFWKDTEAEAKAAAEAWVKAHHD